MLTILFKEGIFLFLKEYTGFRYDIINIKVDAVNLLT